MTVLTIYFYSDYDLASDAQAAIGLFVWPLFVTAGGLAVFVVALGIQSLGRWFNRPSRRADE